MEGCAALGILDILEDCAALGMLDIMEGCAVGMLDIMEGCAVLRDRRARQRAARGVGSSLGSLDDFYRRT